MDIEIENVPASSEEREDILSDTEIAQFFFQKYFCSNPETDAEKTITAEELLKIIKSYYDKCHELEKSIMDDSKTVQRARKELQWYRVLKSDFNIEDLTFVAETFLLEYEMSSKDENKSLLNIKYITEKSPEKENSGDEEKVGISEDIKNSESRDGTSSRKPEECTETLLALYHFADVIENNTLQNWKEFETTDEVDTKKAASSSGKVVFQTASNKKISHARLEFIRTYKVMIRATLMLFKRMNPEWVKQAEKVIEKSSPMKNKRKLLLQGKSISIESSSAEDSLSSVPTASCPFEETSKPEINVQTLNDTMEVDQ